MKFQQRKWRKALVLAVALAAPAVSPAKAAEPQWPIGAYSYFVIDQDIRAVLAEFGRNMHIPVRVSESVPAMQIKGKIGAPSAKAFLQWMCDSYRLTWYFDGAVLQIMSQSELQNAYFDLGPVAPEEFNKRLQEAGIADERFPIRTTGDPKLVSLLAPQPYHTLVRQILNSMKDDIIASQRRLMRPGDQRPVPTRQEKVAPPAGPRKVASDIDGAGDLDAAPDSFRADPRVGPVPGPRVPTAATLPGQASAGVAPDALPPANTLSGDDLFTALVRRQTPEDERMRELFGGPGESRTGKVTVFRGSR